MKTHSSFTESVARGIVALTAFWILGYTFVQLGLRFLGGWPASELAQLLACVAAVAFALRLRTPLVAYFAAAMAAYSASEFVIHLVYGIRAAQGAPTHFAVMGAGVLGVAAGTVLARFNASRQTSHRAIPLPRNENVEATVDENATGLQRSDMPLQPTSGAASASSLKHLSPARG